MADRYVLHTLRDGMGGNLSHVICASCCIFSGHDPCLHHIHLMYWAIMKESKQKFRLNARSIANLIIYPAAAAFGGFCPIAAFIAVGAVSCWWIIPEKKKKA